MVTASSLPTTSPETASKTDRNIDTAELIDRMAEEMRRAGGTDHELPHAYFVEQVKRQLAGQSAANDTAKSDVAAPREKMSASDRYQSAAMFKSWAIPE